MSNLFGPVRQLGYVVNDIDAAMRHWTHSLHIGPFYYRERARILDHRFEGEPCDLRIRFALAYSGNLQIALIQQLDGTPSTFRAFLQEHGAGLHHLGFFSEYFERDVQRANESGLQVLQHNVVDTAEGKLAVFKADGSRGPWPALIALHPNNVSLFDMARREAHRWDGSGPVRRLED